QPAPPRRLGCPSGARYVNSCGNCTGYDPGRAKNIVDYACRYRVAKSFLELSIAARLHRNQRSSQKGKTESKRFHESSVNCKTPLFRVPPRRSITPGFERFFCPAGGLVCVTGSAGIRNFVLLCHS